MRRNTESQLTEKGIQTRQRIMDAAMDLFTQQGYDATTMRDISNAAGCSLGLAYRYFEQKESLAAALFERIYQNVPQQVEELAPGTLSDRYYSLMRLKMAELAPHRELTAALFGAAMRPSTQILVPGMSSGPLRAMLLASFHKVVADAIDRPKSPVAEALGTLLFAMHFLMLLFWLYDRTPSHRASDLMLDFMREAFKMIRPMMIMPLVSKAILKLADLMLMIFGSRADDVRADNLARTGD